MSIPRTRRSHIFLLFYCLVVLVAMEGQAQLITGKVPVGTRGHELYYEVQGTGEPVVLIHGVTLDLRQWDAQVPALSDKYKVIRYDVIGHGRSSGLSSALPNGALNDSIYLRDLLDALEIDKAHVVGLSMGGGIGTRFALDYPERVHTLTPMDSRIWGYNVPSELGERFSSYIDVSQKQGVQAALPLWAADPLFAPANANPAVQAQLEQIVVQGHGSLGAGAYFQWPNFQKVAYPSALNRLTQIAHPTLVMVGELDAIDFKLQADILDRDIPNSTKLIVPNAGHMSNMEQPEFVNAALLDFFASHPISTPLPGDFSGDGFVDAADYVVWRHGLGTSYTHDDYDLWRASFGQTAGSGAAGYALGASAAPLSAAVPEPTSALLLMLGVFGHLSARATRSSSLRSSRRLAGGSPFPLCRRPRPRI
jgi:pimeloyl-ACP methyl ester carboxylesterase